MLPLSTTTPPRQFVGERQSYTLFSKWDNVMQSLTDANQLYFCQAILTPVCLWWDRVDRRPQTDDRRRS